MDLLNPARLALKASLIAQFSATASGDAALDVKAKGIATAFYAASISLGVLVNGTSLPAPTTGPLVLPTAII
jgi:hypothetical protein